MRIIYPQETSPEERPSRSLRDAFSRVPTLEWFLFGLLLFLQVRQWGMLLIMCETEGRFGTSAFIAMMMVSTSIGLSLEVLNQAYKYTLVLSYLAMSCYFLRYGW